jgi:hypothetical protein
MPLGLDDPGNRGEDPAPGQTEAKRARTDSRHRQAGTARGSPGRQGRAPAQDQARQGVRRPYPAWVDGELGERVRNEAGRRGMSQADLFRVAINRTHAQLRARRPQAPSDAAFLDEPFVRRRYRVKTGTQLGLYLTDEEATKVDGFAGEIGMKRSGLVNEVFRLFFELEDGNTRPSTGR